MTDPNMLRTLATVHMQATLPKIAALMEDTDVDLPPYSRLAPGVPGSEVFGNLNDAVERVRHDPAAMNDPLYGGIMFNAALVEIVAALSERVEEVERSLQARGRRAS